MQQFTVSVDAHCPASRWVRDIAQFRSEPVSLTLHDDGTYSATCRGITVAKLTSVRAACEWALTRVARVQMNVTTIRNRAA